VAILQHVTLKAQLLVDSTQTIWQLVTEIFNLNRGDSMNIVKNTVITAVCVGLMSASALSAGVDLPVAKMTDVNGKVMVNLGEGFVPAVLDMGLKAGDRVFVGEQSLATVSYEGCAVVLDKPAVISIKADGGCDVATSIQPVADLPSSADTGPIAGTGPFAGVPPVVLLTAITIPAIACVAACDSVFGKKNRRGVSGQ
jgi:hypothetical protein